MADLILSHNPMKDVIPNFLIDGEDSLPSQCVNRFLVFATINLTGY